MLFFLGGGMGWDGILTDGSEPSNSGGAGAFGSKAHPTRGLRVDPGDLRAAGRGGASERSSRDPLESSATEDSREVAWDRCRNIVAFCQGMFFLPTNGFSIEPTNSESLLAEQKATKERRLPSGGGLCTNPC